MIKVNHGKGDYVIDDAMELRMGVIFCYTTEKTKQAAKKLLPISIHSMGEEYRLVEIYKDPFGHFDGEYRREVK